MKDFEEAWEHLPDEEQEEVRDIEGGEAGSWGQKPGAKTPTP
jgi:hypothetical protein